NLLANALKFVPAGRAPLVRVSATTEGRQACITVSDNGIGIAPEHLDRLFQPFQRLHLRKDYDGTGLGLAISRQIAQRHGGDIAVSATLHEGSRFSVTLPLA
ncbi:MAG: sensor histidine kinase, partial [Hydrogenophaga sp.]